MPRVPGVARIATLWFLGCVVFSGCATVGVPAGTRAEVRRLAEPHGFTARETATNVPVFALLRRQPQSRRLTVFIEGDGAAWFNPRWPPADPTPQHSIMLALALRQTGAVAYLGRPCQYAPAPCPQRLWTTHRFANEAIELLDVALDRLKHEAGAHDLVLVGYSGGGVIATLLAQQRGDVVTLVTLAAPLAVSDWTHLLDISPLPASRDPMNGPALTLPARHFAGGRDRVVPPAVVARFAQEKGGKYFLRNEFDHACCWEKLTSVELFGEDES